MSKDIPGEFPGNSHKERIERKKEMTEQTKDKTPSDKNVEKVISGTAVTRKKGLGRKIAETFTGDDAHSVGQYILFEVIIPAAKSMISDAASQGVERMLFGDSSRRPSSSSYGSGRTNYTAYTKSYSPNREDRGTGPDSARYMSSKARATHDFSEVVLETRVEAEEVMGCMDDLVAEYGVASVNDFYNLVGITGAFTDDKYGWTNLRGADIRRVRQGYLIILPRPEPLK